MLPRRRAPLFRERASARITAALGIEAFGRLAGSHAVIAGNERQRNVVRHLGHVPRSWPIECRHHPADRAGRADHAPAFNARSTAIKVFASAPRATRTVTPLVSTSIVPALASALHRGALRCGTGDDPAPTTAGTNCSPSASERSASESRN